MELTIGDDNRQPIDVSPVNTPKDGCGFIGFLATPLLKEKDAHEEFNVFVRMIEEGLIEEVVFDLRRIHISMSRALLRKECTSIDSLF